MDQIEAEMRKKVSTEMGKLANKPAGDKDVARTMAKIKELGLLDGRTDAPPSVN